MKPISLISTSLDPGAQRAIIALMEKKAPFDLQYVDAAHPPAWMAAATPDGQLPLLRIARTPREDVYVSEPGAILQYIEEAVPGRRLLPLDAIDRALHRAWIAEAETLINLLDRLATAADTSGFAALKQDLGERFYRAESDLIGPYFAGKDLGLVDAAFAPFFVRLSVLESAVSERLMQRYPKLAAWGRTLLAHASVKEAVPYNYAESWLTHLRQRGSAYLRTEYLRAA